MIEFLSGIACGLVLITGLAVVVELGVTLLGGALPWVGAVVIALALAGAAVTYFGMRKHRD